MDVFGVPSANRHQVAALVRAAAVGDQDAWDQLVDRFGQAVWTAARSHGLSVGDAASVSEITWLRLAANLGHMDHPERLGTWLTTTATRESKRLSLLRPYAGASIDCC